MGTAEAGWSGSAVEGDQVVTKLLAQCVYDVTPVSTIGVMVPSLDTWNLLLCARSALHPAFFDIVDVEPDAHDLPGRDVLRNIVFEEHLEGEGHLADAHVAHLVIPLHHVFTVLNSRVFGDPIGDGFIVSSGGDEILKLLVIDSGEIKKEAIERTVVVVVVIGAGGDRAALVEHSPGMDVAGKRFPRTAGNVFRKIKREVGKGHNGQTYGKEDLHANEVKNDIHHRRH